MRRRTDHESVTVFWCMRPNGHAFSVFFADFSVFKRIFSYFSGGWPRETRDTDSLHCRLRAPFWSAELRRVGAEIEGLGHMRRRLYSCYFSLLAKKNKKLLPSFGWEVFYLQFETIRETIGEGLAELIRFAWGRRLLWLIGCRAPCWASRRRSLPPGKHLSKIEEELRHKSESI